MTLPPVMGEKAYLGRTHAGPQEGERITGVSIRCEGGPKTMPPPNRHNDLMRAMKELSGYDTRLIGRNDQGFCTTHRQFVHRDEALLIAKAAKQLLRAGTPLEPVGILTSEDLW